MSSISVRLDPVTETALERLARKMSRSKSEIVRQAIEAWLRRSDVAGERPYDRISDLVGSVRGGPPDLSVDSGRKFRQLLERERG